MTYKESSDYLLKTAIKQGLEIDILATQSRDLSLDSYEEKLTKTTIAKQGGIGVRVIVEGKTGFAYTEEKSPEALDWVLAEAKENALLQTVNDAFLPQGSDLGDSDLLADGLNAPIEDKVDMVIGLEHILRQEPKVKNVQIARLMERENYLTIASTNGLRGSFRNGYVGLLSSLVAQDGESIKQSFDVDLSNKYYQLDAKETADKILKNTLRQLNAKELKSGKYTAYFEPKAFSHLLSMLAFMLNGRTLVEGESLLAKKLNQTVASEIVTLIDDPNLANGLASRPFDAEGTTCKKLELIKNGVLKSFLHNSATAKEAGQPNTGHAARSYKSSLLVAASNLYLEKGSGITLDKGIIVTDLMGTHAGINNISGDFSLQAFGILVEDGKEQHAVENFAIAGNFLDLLKNISAIGKEIEWTAMAGIIGTPMVEVAELSFAGSS